MDACIKEKENLCHFEKTITDVKLPARARTPLRTPLQDVNNLDIFKKSVKKLGLSFTAGGEAAVKTPTRKTAKTRRSILVYHDQEAVKDDKPKDNEDSAMVQSVAPPTVKVSPPTPIQDDTSNNTERESQKVEDRTSSQNEAIFNSKDVSEVEQGPYDNENNAECNDKTETTTDILSDDVGAGKDFILNDLSIFMDHEELCLENSLDGHNTSDHVVLDNAEQATDCIVSESNSHIAVTDHTYAGTSCNSCVRNRDVTDVSCSPRSLPLPVEMACSPCFTSHTSEQACSPVYDHQTDQACSPVPNQQKEQETITDIIDTATTACSPLLRECASMGCSPILQDFSSMGCSPIPSRFTTVLTDIGCSPAFTTITAETFTMTNDSPAKQEFGLQIQPDTASVLCSPFRLPTSDCGTSTIVSNQDVTTSTDVVECIDQGVDVRPMMTADSTMTEYFLIDSETSMTPIKFLNKKGHRITADEIRKQHPRTLANKLDTSAVEIERLLIDNKKLEKERDRFKSKVTEMKASVSAKNVQDMEDKKQEAVHEEVINKLKCDLEEKEKENQKLKEEIVQLQVRLGELEEGKKESEKAQSTELEALKQEMEGMRNGHQIRSAHNLILELQTELAEYKELTDSLKVAEQLQVEIQQVIANNYSKVRAAADRLLSMKRSIDTERNDIVQQKSDNEKENERLTKEYRDMTDQYDNLKHSLETSRSSMMQIELLYESTSADLLNATNQVQILSKELLSTKEALGMANKTILSFEKEVADLRENDKAAVLEISCFYNTLQNSREEYNELKTRSEEMERRYKSRVDLLQAENGRLDLLAVNLQRTVDSLNDDIDNLEKDLFTTHEFSTEQANRIVSLDDQLSITTRELEQTKQENMELRDSLAVFRGNQEYLQQSIDLTERQLQQKTSEFERQNKDWNESSFLVTELENKMACVLEGLRSRAGLSSKSDLQSPTTTSKEVQRLKSEQKKKTRKPIDQSFLSMVIKAAEGQSDSEYESCKSSPSMKSSPSTSPYIDGVAPLEEELSTVCEKLKDRDSIEQESPGSLSRNRLGFSETGSAFAPVRTSVIKPKQGPLGSGIKSNMGQLSSTVKEVKAKQNLLGSSKKSEKEQFGSSLKVKHTDTNTSVHKYNSGLVDSTRKNLSMMSQSQLEDCNLSLCEQIECLAETFSEIIRCASIIEKASRLSIQDLQDENEDLSQQFEECQESEQKTKEELSIKQDQLYEAEEKLSGLSQTVERLSEELKVHIQKETEVLYLKSLLSNMKSQIEQLEAEKDILSSQLKEVLSQSKDQTSCSENVARYHNEITALRLKIQKLKEQIKYHEQLATKASKRMKTLDENWKKAEEEVYKFDQLVDVIRETLINSGLIPKNKETLGRIIRMIDGFETVPSKPETLNPVKTALW